jgi:cell pole-organizing protein PopZ
MSQGKSPEQEPSIEEILASIRQIISDDDGDSPDNDVDLGGDDDLGVSTAPAEDDEHDN